MVKKKLKNKNIRKTTRKSKKFSFHNEFDEAWNYLKSSRNYIVVVSLLFALFFILGFSLIYIAPPEILDPLLDEIRKMIEEIIKESQGKNFIEMWWFIFFNNSSIGFISILGGILFGIFPIIFLISNGVSIGLISSLVASKEGLWTLWMLVPHGIFEIPAIIISFAIGIKLGAFIFNKNIWKEFKFRLQNSLRVFFLIILPLFIIASIIEAGLIVFFSG